MTWSHLSRPTFLQIHSCAETPESSLANYDLRRVETTVGWPDFRFMCICIFALLAWRFGL